MKKGDVILTGSILLVAVLLFLGIQIYYRYSVAPEPNRQVVVTIDGTEYGRYDLDTRQQVEILTSDPEGNAQRNVLQIAEDTARMIEADCPDQLCVHQLTIKQEGQMIICLPHHIVVEIED